jgi:Dolichyl-phosphate-mannose-protein mannosyltransferase
MKRPVVKKWLGFISLVFIFGLACTLRVWQLDRLDLWGDEIFTVFQASRSLGGLVDIAIRDTALPLYPVLLHFWMMVGGDSVIAVRSLSIVIDLIGLVVFYFLSRKFTGNWGSLGLACLYSVNFIAIYYARETRAYGLLMLLSSFSALATLNFIDSVSSRQKITWGGLLAVSLGLGLYTHNLGIFIIVSSFLYLFLRMLNRFAVYTQSLQVNWPRKLKIWTEKQDFWSEIWSLVFLGLGVLALILPGLAIILVQSQTVKEEGFWLKFNPVSSTMETLADLASGMHLVTWNSPNVWDISLIGLTLFFVAIATIKVLIVQKAEPNDGPPALFFWVSFTGMFVLSFSSPVMYVRYASFLVPFVILLMYQGIVALRVAPPWKMVLVVIMVILQLQTYFTHHLRDDSSKPQYSRAAAYISQNSSTTPALLLSDMSPFYGFKYYGRPEWEIKIYDPYRETPFYYGVSQTVETDFSRSVDGFENKPKFWWVRQSKKITPSFLSQEYELNMAEEFPGNLEVELWVKKEG